MFGQSTQRRPRPTTNLIECQEKMRRKYRKAMTDGRGELGGFLARGGNLVGASSAKTASPRTGMDGHEKCASPAFCSGSPTESGNERTGLCFPRQGHRPARAGRQAGQNEGKSLFTRNTRPGPTRARKRKKNVTENIPSGYEPRVTIKRLKLVACGWMEEDLPFRPRVPCQTHVPASAEPWEGTDSGHTPPARPQTARFPGLVASACTITATAGPVRGCRLRIDRLMGLCHGITGGCPVAYFGCCNVRKGTPKVRDRGRQGKGGVCMCAHAWACVGAATTTTTTTTRSLLCVDVTFLACLNGRGDGT